MPDTRHVFLAELSTKILISFSPLSSVADAVTVTVSAVVGLAGEWLTVTYGGLSRLQTANVLISSITYCIISKASTMVTSPSAFTSAFIFPCSDSSPPTVYCATFVASSARTYPSSFTSP